ncbi:hypothetical protein CF8_0198 [Aeromonas phage CF8]|nr:hypothetical protein CF8_0198 [Aeromonas phage CF8]
MSEQEQQAPETPKGQINSLHLSGLLNDDNVIGWLQLVHSCSAKDACRIFIGSYGGNIDSAFTFKDAFESKLFPIALIAEGTIASAAWYLFSSRKYLRLTYANVLWLQHAPSYQPAMTHDELMGALPGLIETSQRGHQVLAEGVGLSHKEVDELFHFKGTRVLGLDTIWLGEYGLTDGVIFRDTSKISWIVLTREGFKEATVHDNHDTLKAKELLTDEFLEPFGLKQYVPTPRPLPTLKTAIAGLSHLTKQAEQRK